MNSPPLNALATDRAMGALRKRSHFTGRIANRKLNIRMPNKAIIFKMVIKSMVGDPVNERFLCRI